MTIGLCTDSNSQMPSDLAAQLGVEVVPLTVTVDGVDYLEGVDLDADGFWAFFDGGRTPAVATAQPSPGRIAAAYRALAERGATEILSIHVGGALSGTINSARLAADHSPVPVRLVDTGTASFGISCCVWAAANAIAAGADIDGAAHVAQAIAPTLGNVFVVGALDLVRAGGRYAGDDDDIGDSMGAVAVASNALAVPILSLREGKVDVVTTCASVATAADAMTAMILAAADHEHDVVNVAIGIADNEGRPLSDAMRYRLVNDARVRECVDYRVGPSIGAHTGPGTAGAFWFTPLRPATR